MIISESDSIRILCEARGSPPLMITWQRAIHPNSFVRLSENTHIHSNSTYESCNITVQQSIIEIHSARVEDGVEYICQAQNDYLYVMASKQLKINVQSGSDSIISKHDLHNHIPNACTQFLMNVPQLHARTEESVSMNIWLSPAIVLEQSILEIGVKSHYILVSLIHSQSCPF